MYLAGEGRECAFGYEDGTLRFDRVTKDGTRPVYIAEFDAAPEVSSTPKEAGGSLHLHIAGAKSAKKSTPGEEPRSLAYIPGRAVAKSAAISNTDKITGWTNSDEYLVFEGEVNGGTYAVELVHALSRNLYGGPFDHVSALLTIGGETHSVGEEKYRYAVSRTGTENTHVVRDVGTFTLPRGRVGVILENTENAENIPVIEIRLKALQ